MANVLKDAKVGFLTGLQSSVDTMLSQGANAGAKHGYFYLTKDSHRLYVGNSDGSLSSVNEGVQTVTYLSDLPTLSSSADKVAYTGRFYYVQYKDSTAGQVSSNVANILCVYNGSSWVQINANTNTTITSTAFTASAASNVATVKNTITDTDGAQKSGDFTITGAGGILATASGKNVTLTGDRFVLSAGDGNANEVKLNLTSTNGQASSAITLKSDPNTTAFIRSDNTITIKGRTNQTLAIANAASGSTGFTVTVTDTEGQQVTGKYDPTIKYGGDGSSAAKLENGVFTLNAYNKAEIDQLLRDLDAMEYRGTVGANGSAALTWDACTKLTQKIGYTYLFSSDFTIKDGDKTHTYTIGTLAIARGTEYTTSNAPSTDLIGTIIPNTIKWDFVESTTDTDTTYHLETNSSGVGFALKDSIGGIKGEIKYVGANGLTISESSTGASTSLVGATNTITVTHDNVTRSNTSTALSSKNQGAATSINSELSTTKSADYVVDTITIPIITSLTTNAQGHVTGVNTVNYKLTDTGTRITGLAQAATATNNQATITTTISALNANGGNMVTAGTAKSTISTSSLTIGASGSNVSIDMTWGEF